MTLSEPIRLKIDALPESGAGYHVLDIVLRDGRIVANVLVFNATDAQMPAEFKDIRAKDVVGVEIAERAQRHAATPCS